MDFDTLRLVRTWGDDVGRVTDAEPRLALIHDPRAVLVVTGAGLTRLDADTGRRAEMTPWSPRPALAPNAPIAIDGSGARVLMGTHQGEVLLYRTGGGTLERRFGRPRGPITHAALSDDGAIAVDACEDGFVRLWPTSGDGESRTLRGNGPVSISPDARRVAYWRGGVRVVDVETGEEQRLDAPSSMRRTRWSCGGAFLWLLGEGRGAACWHLASNTRVGVFVRAVTTEATGCDREGALVMVDRSGAIHRMTPDGRVTTLAPTLDESVHDAAISPDATRAAWLRHGSTLCVRDLTTGRESHHHGEHAGSITALAISPDGARAATAGTDRSVRVWDVSSGETAWALEGPKSTVLDVAFSPDGARLYAACAEDLVRVWTLTDGQELDPVACAGVGAIRVSPDGGRIVTVHRKGRGASIVDLARGVTARLDCAEVFEHKAACFAGDGDEVVALVVLNMMYLLRFDGRDASPRSPPKKASGDRLELAGLMVPVLPRGSAAFSRDGALLASETSSRGLVHVWSANTRRGVRLLQRDGRSADVLPMALGAARVVVPTRDQVEVWDHRTGGLVGELDLRATGEHPVAIALSPSEDVLLVATSLARVHHVAMSRLRPVSDPPEGWAVRVDGERQGR